MAAYNRAARRKAGKVMKRVADKHGTTLAEVWEGLENCRRAVPLHVRNGASTPEEFLLYACGQCVARPQGTYPKT